MAEPVTVVDCWRCLDPRLADDPRITYVPLGRCVDDGPATATLEALWTR
jgi:hypothetical protein